MIYFCYFLPGLQVAGREWCQQLNFTMADVSCSWMVHSLALVDGLFVPQGNPNLTLSLTMDVQRRGQVHCIRKQQHDVMRLTFQHLDIDLRLIIPF